MLAHPKWLDSFKVGGYRDWGLPTQTSPWVPDPSCMAPIFNAHCPAPSKRVCYFVHASEGYHKTDFMNTFGLTEAEVFLNNGAGHDDPLSYENFVALRDYFCSCESVVTSSFHGVVWATYLQVPLSNARMHASNTPQLHGCTGINRVQPVPISQKRYLTQI